MGGILCFLCVHAKDWEYIGGAFVCCCSFYPTSVVKRVL